MTGAILVTGATGFIGSRVAAGALAAAVTSGAEGAGGHPVRLLVHRRPVGPLPEGRAETPVADLADPASLRGVCDGAHALVHCASYVGDDPETCEVVNARGTAALVDEARRAGVSRIVYLSTAAVYGDGVFRRLPEGGAACLPVSAASRTRLAAEQSVLGAGGVVVRPYLVYGAGDEWFVPGLVALMGVVGGLVEGGRARLSLIDVDALAAAALAAATSPGAPGDGLAGVYHVNHPRPVRLRDLCAEVCRHLDVPGWTGRAMTYEQALRRVLAAGRRRHHLDMLAVDHWFDSSRIWAQTGCPPGPGFARGFASHAPWYRLRLGL